ncbi:ISAon1 family transposase N-terminal region protein [Pseudoflavitalea rhizosphaerae]|uniref:ISAon1 family transposase N-terminal region protein n=1 Tax=Pseudoflavitalea rhizosphaerae TaxID=1884793 RepID=UPI003B9768C1
MLFLEEKNFPPAEYQHQILHSKGFPPEVRVQGFPIRDQKVILSIRRRWEITSTGEIVSRNCDLVMQGARLTKEFQCQNQGLQDISQRRERHQILPVQAI